MQRADTAGSPRRHGVTEKIRKRGTQKLVSPCDGERNPNYPSVLFSVTPCLRGEKISLKPGRSRRSGLVFLPVPLRCAAVPELCRSLLLAPGSCSGGSSRQDERPEFRFRPGLPHARQGECG